MAAAIAHAFHTFLIAFSSLCWFSKNVGEHWRRVHSTRHRPEAAAGLQLIEITYAPKCSLGLDEPDGSCIVSASVHQSLQSPGRFTINSKKYFVAIFLNSEQIPGPDA